MDDQGRQGHSSADGAAENNAEAVSRRTFVKNASAVTMAGGLAASYGMFGVYAGRFVYPSSSEPTGWMFVTQVVHMKVGQVMSFRTPKGATVSIARQGPNDTADDFMALSSTCPHLGCKVYWQARENRYFCPCHNGVFDTSGKATAGPPAEAGQELPSYALKVENGLLFIAVELPDDDSTT